MSEETNTEKVEVPAEGQEETTLEEGGEQETEVEVEVEAKEDEGEGKKDEESHVNPAVQKRINKITAEKYAAKKAADYWKGIAQNNQPASQPAVAPESVFAKPEPREEDFDSNEAYVKAFGLHQVEKYKTEADASAKATTANEQAGKRITTFYERADEQEITGKYPDFHEVIEKEVFTPRMTELVQSSEHGPELAYYLGNNPEVALKIADMDDVSPAEAMREIIKLEQQFAIKPNKKNVSKAAEPISPVDSGGSHIPKDADKLPMNEYAAKLNREKSY